MRIAPEGLILSLANQLPVVLQRTTSDGAVNSRFEGVADLPAGATEADTMSSGANGVVSRPPFLTHIFEQDCDQFVARIVIDSSLCLVG